MFNVSVYYKITKEEIYAKKICDFILKVEKYKSHKEYNGMESSLRSINLSFIHYILKGSKYYKSYHQNIIKKEITSLGSYIYRNYDITFYGLESNHALTCSIGLIYLSLILPSYKFSSRWYNLGKNTLIRNIKNQYNEGINFENSSHYHRFTFELILFLYSFSYEFDIKINQILTGPLKKIIDGTKFLTHKSYYLSRFGDNDGGKFLPSLNLIQEETRIDYLENILKGNNLRYELIFIKNLPIISKSDKIKKSDFYSIQSKNYSLIINANNIGTLGLGNHQHLDISSFELYSIKPFIVDPWSFCYNLDKNERNKYRSNNVHNLVSINNKELIKLDSNIFKLLGFLRTKNNFKFKKNEILDIYIDYNFYNNFFTKNCRRIFRIDKKKSKIKINDIIKQKGKNFASIVFIFL